MLKFFLWQWMGMLTPMFFGIGMGPSGSEKSEFGSLANIGNFATSLGEKNLSTASNFWNSILSGDPGQISKVLGPTLSSMNKRTQERKKTAAEFGNRGGGTNATMQSLDSDLTGNINSLFSELTTTAAGNVGSLGAGLLSQGASAHEGAFGEAKTIHDQNAAKWNDFFKTAAQIASSFGGPVGDLGTALS